MGNDGGSIPDRRDLVRNKPKAEQADKHNQMIAQWFFCALSKRPLQEPIVSCALGKLYNKDVVLEYLLDKTVYGDGEKICGHIRSLKDVKTLKLTHNPARPTNTLDSERHAPFACPLTCKEMIGTHPFVYLAPCGCVFSQAGLRAVCASAGPPAPGEHEEKDVCPQCGTKYTRSADTVLLNPGADAEAELREALEARRAAQAGKPRKTRKRKAEEDAAGAGAGAGAAEPPPPKRAAAALNATPAPTPKRSARSTPQPTTNSATATSRTVANALALEEQKRRGGMSEAVKSLYTARNDKKNETFMTRGTFTRYA